MLTGDSVVIKRISLVSLLFVAANVAAMNEPYDVKGLDNIGNSCFINSAVQVMYGMTDLTNTILSLDDGIYKDGSLAAAYGNLIKEIKTKKTEEIDPTLFDILTWLELPDLAGRQCDAHEVIIKLLECLSRKSIIGPLYTQKLTDSISHFYTVASVSTLYNVPLNYVSGPRRESTQTLELKVPPSSQTLNQCLAAHFQPSTELYTVNGNRVECARQKYLKETQNYLIISLDRLLHFTNSEGNPEFLRIGNPISFPLYNLQLKHYFGDQQDDKGPYELIGVIMHSSGNGTGNSGHFTSFVKSGNQWHFCNDKTITPINEEDLYSVTQRGYGDNKQMVATTLVYELGSARPQYPAAKRQPTHTTFLMPQQEKAASSSNSNNNSNNNNDTDSTISMINGQILVLGEHLHEFLTVNGLVISKKSPEKK